MPRLLAFQEADRPSPLEHSVPHVYHVEGARFVKLHFSRLQLPEGVAVEVSSRDGSETWRYGQTRRDPFTVDAASGDDGKAAFWAMSISGDTALVRLTGDLARVDPARHVVTIDRWYTGADASADEPPAGNAKHVGDMLETTCGADEAYDAVCWESSHPDEFERSWPVVLIISTTGKKCTAWRVGEQNRLFTARHCIASQSDLDGAEIWFNYQATVCGGDEMGATVKVTGGDLLAEDYALDYALFTVDDFSSISRFGNLGLDLRDGDPGEGIFIPQHGLGWPKQIAIESDMNESGFCEIDDNALDGMTPDSDIGYFCDTTTSSSGSPVISAVTGRAIALHHWGGCLNSGTKVSRIWPEVAGFFGGRVPEGDATGDWALPNESPSADFTAYCEDLDCRFDGGDSEDPDGEITAWTWSIDGAAEEGAVVDHRFVEGGIFPVTLTVADDEGATDTVTRMVIVSEANDAPTARFSTQCIATDCIFDGGDSDDPDGAVVAWSWQFGDGATASGTRVDHEFAEAGSYTVTLTVHDDDEAADAASQTVSVSAPNQPPVARFTVACEDLECSVDAADSYDPDGSIAAFSWNFGNGGSATGSTAGHRYATAGSYTIRLEVTDDRGLTADASEQVTVEAPNALPEARFSGDCAEGRCTFDGSASSDSDGAITGYAWSFGDGYQAYGEVVEHEYGQDGSYAVTLTVTDDDGSAASVSRTFDITVPSAEPQANFTVSCDELDCVLDAGSSVASSGTIANYDWSLGDGSNATGGQVFHRYAEPGRYTVTLKITDSNQASGSRSRTIEVESRAPIVLEARVEDVKDRPVARLAWSHAETTTVDVYRNGRRIATVPDSGEFVDDSIKVAGAYGYRVCEAASQTCSNLVKLSVTL